MLIHEVASLLGVSPDTVRYDERTLTVDRRLEFLRGKPASMDRRAGELGAALAVIAAKIVDLESRV
jgi:hypothetical protein